ncbi:MAG: hypothetical protein JWP15_3246 [Alphaproteobacteria bacterium]|nr:hypothetical protein [Alphaproteobacteria bacterium]
MLQAFVFASLVAENRYSLFRTILWYGRRGGLALARSAPALRCGFEYCRRFPYMGSR